jgi:ribosomal protein L16/L10AE
MMTNTRMIAKRTLQFLFKNIERARVIAKSRLEKITNCLRMTLAIYNHNLLSKLKAEFYGVVS